MVYGTLADTPVVIARPPPNGPSLCDLSFRPLFQCLSAKHVIQCFTVLLMDGRICLSSSRVALLTPVAEALLALLQPFTFEGTYVPVLPSVMLDVLDAPVPFLVGVHASALETTPGGRGVVPPGVVLVELDHDAVGVLPHTPAAT